MTSRPRHLHVYQRIMGDVDGVGDFSQELTDGDGFLSADSASGSHGNDQRKDYQDAYGFVDSVHPEVKKK